MTLEITRYRGDTVSDVFTITDSSGSPQDITGSTVKMTLDERKAPPDATTLVLELTGTLTNPSAGEVTFTWTALNADQEPGSYWFDIELTSGSVVQTLVVGKYTFIQDISK